MGPKKKQQTPVKVYEENSNLHETFSPVIGKGIQDSTGLRQGNLTGSVRKLKDSAADLHNLMQKWNILNVDGSNIISQIANIKLDQTEQKELDMLPETLLPLCEQLSQLLKKMEKLALRLSAMLDTVKGIAQLERYNQSNSAEIILFQTWDVLKYGDVFEEVCVMVRRELDLKKCIAANVCHGKNRDVIMFYSAAWLHQPYINSNTELLIDSLLFETKLKT